MASKVLKTRSAPDKCIWTWGTFTHRPKTLLFGDGDECLALHGWALQNQPRENGIPDGLSEGMERVRALGNAVVPAVAAHAFRTLAEEVK